MAGVLHGTAGARQRQLEIARQADVAPLAVDLAVLVDRVELVEQPARALARSEEQIAARLEREMKQRQDRLLRVRLEVDQQVAAGDQIELGERRIADDVVRREDDALAQVLRDLVAVGAKREERLEPLGLMPGNLFLGVDAGARDFERRLVDVGREDLEVDGRAPRAQLLVKQHRDRVRFLAGGAAGHPDADLLAGTVGVERFDDLRDDALLEHRERLVVAEEPRHADQQVFVERVQLARIAAQLVDVRVEIERRLSASRRSMRRVTVVVL